MLILWRRFISYLLYKFNASTQLCCDLLYYQIHVVYFFMLRYLKTVIDWTKVFISYTRGSDTIEHISKGIRIKVNPQFQFHCMHVAKGADICLFIWRDCKNGGPFSQEGRQTRLFASSEKKSNRDVKINNSHSIKMINIIYNQ